MNIMYLTSEDQDKLRLIDDVFNAFTEDELKILLGQELVINKLKGIPPRLGIFQGLALDNISQHTTIQKLESDLTILRSEMYQARSDIMTLIKFLNDKFNNYNAHQAEFNTMKSKYGIY